MAKVKVSKKSTRIDMTAMCDVAFLLLSFFIMTATAKQPEPKPVDTPASTVLDKLPEEGVAMITVGDKDVYFTIPLKLRRATLENMETTYKMKFTEEQKKKFVAMDGFGVPMNQLKSLLELSITDRNKPGVQIGIPYDSINNQLGDWVKQARAANRTYMDEQIAQGIITPDKNKDLDIAIKGDSKEEYPTIKRVIEILQEQDKNKFFLVTGLRDENF